MNIILLGLQDHCFLREDLPADPKLQLLPMDKMLHQRLFSADSLRLCIGGPVKVSSIYRLYIYVYTSIRLITFPMLSWKTRSALPSILVFPLLMITRYFP